MKLEVPIIYQGDVFTTCEIGKLKAGVVANATEEMQSKGDFAGMHKLITGCLKSLSTDDGNEITSGFDSVVKAMPIQTAELLSLAILTNGKDIGVEQISVCPRCNDRVIYEDEEDEDGEVISKRALHFSDLKVLPLEGDQTIHVALDEDIEIKTLGGKEILFSISSIDFRYPTLGDGIKASSMVPGNKDARRQYAIYCNAITHVNGDEVEEKFRVQWGMFVLERMCIDDMELISKAMRSCGVKKTVRRECMKCGKKWNDPINLSGFFESGLQL